MERLEIEITMAKDAVTYYQEQVDMFLKMQSQCLLTDAFSESLEACETLLKKYQANLEALEAFKASQEVAA